MTIRVWWCVSLCSDFAKASISTNLYTYKELKRATRGFHQDNKLGEGGFGEVFLVSTRTIFHGTKVVEVNCTDRD